MVTIDTSRILSFIPDSQSESRIESRGRIVGDIPLVFPSHYAMRVEFTYFYFLRCWIEWVIQWFLVALEAVVYDYRRN